MPEFQPFVSPDENRPEFTFRALLLGSLFGIIFGGVTVYVGLTCWADDSSIDSDLSAFDQYFARIRPGFHS